MRFNFKIYKSGITLTNPDVHLISTVKLLKLFDSFIFSRQMTYSDLHENMLIPTRTWREKVYRNIQVFWNTRCKKNKYVVIIVE